MFSMVIRERFLKDEKETRKYLKEFSYYDRTLLPPELIKTIDDNEYINATHLNTTRILSKTYYKK